MEHVPPESVVRPVNDDYEMAMALLNALRIHRWSVEVSTEPNGDWHVELGAGFDGSGPVFLTAVVDAIQKAATFRVVRGRAVI